MLTSPTGVLAFAAQWTISCIRSNPWLEVAVNVLHPVWLADMHDAKALCSDSTVTYWPLKEPSATNSAIFSTIVVCGVIGYALTTSTPETRAP
jgi:hypothetical protein